MSATSLASLIRKATPSNFGSHQHNNLRDSAGRDLCKSGPTPKGPATGGVVMHNAIPLTVALVAAFGVSGCTKGAKAAADPAQIEQSIRAQEAQWQKDYA